MKNAVLLSVAVGATVAVAQPVLADPIDDAIKARQSYYQVVRFNAGPLFGMAKGKVAYDAKRAQTLANNLKALAAMSNGAMWVKGSDNVAKKGNTRAKPEIWAAGSDIGDKAKAFKAAINDLAGAAGGGLDGLKPKVAALGKACGGCHKPFRAKDF